MPLPSPGSGEDRKGWLDRCMGEPVMNEEYPDNKQRYAVCNSLWDRWFAKKLKEVGHAAKG
jgi:hypothetical protein